MKYKKHPELFKQALVFERHDFTWIKGMSLLDLLYKGKDIEDRYNRKINKEIEENDDELCTICNL